MKKSYYNDVKMPLSRKSVKPKFDKKVYLKKVFLPDDIPGQFARIMIWYFGRPTRSNAAAAIYERHGNNGSIELWLNALIVVDAILVEIVVHFGEDFSGQG